ncbi:hypothetical protein ACWGFX_18090 [Streptomyces xanthophaeus]
MMITGMGGHASGRMTMFASRTRRACVTALASALISVPVLAGAASAVDMDAPYARAAAKVAANGTLVVGKNIESVRRAQAGIYCVKIAAAAKVANLREAAILATSNGDTVLLRTVGNPIALCGNAADTVAVYSNKIDTGAWTDSAFTVAVL